MSAARQGFKSRDLAYYERLFDTFGDLIEFKVSKPIRRISDTCNPS